MKLSNYFITMLIIAVFISVFSSCQTAFPSTETNTTADTQATPTTELVEGTTEEITEASTTPPEELKSVIYIGLSSENIADLNLGSSSSFDFQPIDNLFPDVPSQQIKKEDINNLQIQVQNKTVTVPYQETLTKDVSSDFVKYHETYDQYYTSNNSVAYEYFADGKLKSFHNTALYHGEKTTLVSDEDATQISKDFIKGLYGDEFDFDEYTFYIYNNTRKKNVIISRNLHGYSTYDSCRLSINTDGVVCYFSADYLGLCDYFKDITPEQIAEASAKLESASNGTGYRLTDFQGTLEMRDDGKLYLIRNATGWTYNEYGMIDEDSYQIGVDFCICVNP